MKLLTTILLVSLFALTFSAKSPQTWNLTSSAFAGRWDCTKVAALSNWFTTQHSANFSSSDATNNTQGAIVKNWQNVLDTLGGLNKGINAALNELDALTGFLGEKQHGLDFNGLLGYDADYSTQLIANCLLFNSAWLRNKCYSNLNASHTAYLKIKVAENAWGTSDYVQWQLNMFTDANHYLKC